MIIVFRKLTPLLLLLALSCSQTEEKNERAELKMGLGIGYLQSQKFPEALSALQEARALQPESLEIENNLGLAYFGLENWKEAEAAFQRALSLNENFPEALSNLCSTYNQMGRFQDAVKMCERALSIETYTNPEFAMTNLGIAHTQLNETKKAEEWFSKALSKNFTFCQAHTELGKLLLRTKRYIVATRSFETAVRQCPLFQEAHYRLGLSLFHSGQRKRSVRVFEDMIQRFPESSFVAPAQKYIVLLSTGKSQ